MRFGLFIMGTRTGSCQDILEQACSSEELGFQGVLLAERHFRHGDLLCPSPFTLAAAIAARTRRLRIGTAARILPLDHPLRLAEEAAVLDLLSGGRLDFGATRASLDEDCHRVFGSPLSESRGRFEEALQVITRAWTEERFSHAGKYYPVGEAAGLPRPLQKPHPPIYLVAGSPETTAFAARKGYSAFLPAVYSLEEFRQASAVYWAAFQGTLRESKQVALALNRFVYVADTDARARQEIRAPFLNFVHERAPDLRAALRRKYGSEPHACFDRFAEDFFLFGAPDTVAARLRELQEAAGLTYLLCSLNFITLEHGLCVRSMELFAREVMPRFATPARDGLPRGRLWAS